MPILDPPSPNEGDKNSSRINSLPLQAQFEFLKRKSIISGLFDEAKIKLSSTNKDAILGELQKAMLGIVLDSFLESRSKDELLRISMVGSYTGPDEEKLSPIRQKYYQKGKMYWGKDEEDNGILMLKLNSEDTWSPHTDDKWSELLCLSDRNRGVTIPGASNGIGEYQFLIKFMEWDIISKP